MEISLAEKPSVAQSIAKVLGVGWLLRGKRICGQLVCGVFGGAGFPRIPRGGCDNVPISCRAGCE